MIDEDTGNNLSDQAAPEPACMAETDMRQWLDTLPKEDLIDLFVSYVTTYLQGGESGVSTISGPLGELTAMTFGQLIVYLKNHLSLPELRRLQVDGARVTYLTETGFEVPINAAGETRPPEGASTGSARSEPRPSMRRQSDGSPARMAPREPFPDRGPSMPGRPDGGRPGMSRPPMGGQQKQPAPKEPASCKTDDDDDDDDRFSMLEID